MSTPGTGYDEIGSRTRQAWLRTSLGVVAVTLLVLRGLALADAAAWVMIACLVPATVVLTLAIVRSIRLQHGESAPMTGRMTVGMTASIAILAILSGAGAAVGLVAR